MTDCPTPNQLQQLLESALHDFEQTYIEDHIDNCTACQRSLERMTANPQLTDPPSRRSKDDTFVARLRANLPAVEIGSRPVPKSVPAPNIPGFEIERELGRGGMGVVYLARHRRLNRLVALKMLTDGAINDPALRARFLLEAETIAQLRHPHVVQIYEFGEHAGVPYFAMEYVESGSLAAALLLSGPMPPIVAARLLSGIVRGVQAVHDLGVIHRDLKPANILLQVEGRKADVSGADDSHVPTLGLYAAVTKVTDFGIAKWATRMNLTETGMVMGTPAYMAPEQATGDARFIGIGADIYSLGVLLYECIAGRTPFVAETPHSLMFKLVHDDPPPLRKFAINAPRDLELICGKCLAKLPMERYSSAAAMADDLDRYIAGDAVSVSPPGHLEQAVRWVRKHPSRSVAYALTMLTVVLSGFATGAMALYRQAESLRQQAVVAKVDAEEARGKAENAKATAELVSAQFAIEKARHETDLAYREYESANVALAKTLLDGVPPIHRHWEWNYAARLCGREVRRLSYPTREPSDPWNVFLNVAAFTNSGDLFTSGMAGARIWPTKGDPYPLLSNRESVATAAVSRDGRRAAVAQIPDTIVLSLPDRKEIMRFTGVPNSLSFSEDGSRLVRGPTMGQVLVTDLTNGVTKTILNEVDFGNAVAISPDGERIATGQTSVVGGREVGLVRVWTTSGEVSPFQFVVGTKNVPALAFSSDGTRLAAGSEDGEVMAWEMLTSHPVGPRMPHPAKVHSVAFNPTGQLVATACADRVVRVWRLDPHGGGAFVVFTFKGHTAPVMSVAFSPDGKQLASASADGTVRFWDVSGMPDVIRFPQGGQSPVIAVVPGEGRLAIADVASPLSVFDLRTERVMVTKKSEPIREIYSLCIDPTRTVATVYSSLGQRAYSLAENDPPGGTWMRVPTPPVTASADGSLAFTRVEKTGQVAILDATGRVLARTGLGHRGQPAWTACSDDGQRVVTGGWDRNAVLWDAKTGAELAQLVGHNTEVTKAAINPDGTRIATGAEDGVVKVWDVRTRRAVLTFASSQQRITGLAWGRDGHVLYSANRHGFIQVFDGTPLPGS